MTTLPIRRVVLYKHGVGYFEREGTIEGDATLSLTFKQAEVSDVLKSLTVLDLAGGHIASVSYDSTKPLAQLLADVALSIPDRGSLVGLLPQIKGARLAVTPSAVEGRIEGVLLGVDTIRRHSADGVVRVVLVSLLTDSGSVRSFPLHELASLEILDTSLRRDLDYYLKTQLSAKKKDARTFSFFAKGSGQRGVRISYTLEAPVWKATYRIILGEEKQPPLIQGWAVVDNTQDEDWDQVQLSLVAGLPVSFVHDLYTPRYIRRPVVAVQETTGVLPPVVEDAMDLGVAEDEAVPMPAMMMAAGAGRGMAKSRKMDRAAEARQMETSTPAQVRERKVGDLFEYEIEHPVTIRRNQSALVPIVLRHFEGRPVLLHNRKTRRENPMRCVELKNTTGLTLEGGPVSVLEGGSYVGEAMLDTLKPDEERLVPYAVELSVHVLDNVDTHTEPVHRVIIRDGQLTRFADQFATRTYHLDNRSDMEQLVYLDHPRESGWTLVEPAQPHRTTENFWRFRFTLPAKTVTRFSVKERLQQSQVQMLAHMNTQELALWLEQKHLDARTAQGLRTLIQLQRTVADLDQRLARLEEERQRIHHEQTRIRDNLQALGDRPSEKELRERFIRTIGQQEDRLEQIATQADEATAQRDQARGQVNATLAELAFEG